MEIYIKAFMRIEMRNIISTDYIDDIVDEIWKDVVDDVKETSSWSEDGTYSEDDIRLAVGRVLIDRLGIERI